jgi:hypothetical protein
VPVTCASGCMVQYKLYAWDQCALFDVFILCKLLQGLHKENLITCVHILCFFFFNFCIFFWKKLQTRFAHFCFIISACVPAYVDVYDTECVDCVFNVCGCQLTMKVMSN